MPRDLDILFKEETVKEEQSQLYHLISFLNIPTVPTPTNIHIVDANVDVLFDGVTYVKFPVAFSGIEMTSSGEINKAGLVVANPSRIFQAYLEQFIGLRGIRVLVKTVFDKFVDTGTSPDSTAAIEDEFIIDSFVSQEQTITFQLDPIVDFDIKLPRRRYIPTVCGFRYKDPDTCSYPADGPLGTCTKDILDCKAHNNEARFGGFPGVPSGRIRRVYF